MMLRIGEFSRLGRVSVKALRHYEAIGLLKPHRVDGAAGGSFKDIVKINNYCVASVDAAEIATYREVRDRYFDMAAPPTSTFVYVSRLVQPDWLFEIDAMAVIDS